MKAQERIEHYVTEVERENDPRKAEPDPVPIVQEANGPDGQEEGPQEFDIGSPGRDVGMEEEDGLDDGPTHPSERRIRSPTRTAPSKRRSQIHDEEPDTKRIILDEVSDDDDMEMQAEDLSMMNEKKIDSYIVCQAILGKDLHEVYSQSRIRLAVDRQSVEHLFRLDADSEARASGPPQRGTRPGGGDTSVDAAPQRGTRPGGVLGDAEVGSVDVVDIFSPERVGKACVSFGLEQGMAMDIKSGFDFDLAVDRARCWETIKRDKPLLVIGSPPCTLFSRLQELNKFMYKDSAVWMAKFQERMQQAKRYVKVCVDIYLYQREQGRYFLHEHPWLATSWSLECITSFLEKDDVRRVQTHMCQLGMVSRTGGAGSEVGPVLKPTGFMTNSVHIANELHRLCPRDHKHVHLVGGRAAEAAIYPPGLCKAICKGLAKQKREDQIGTIRTPALSINGLSSLSIACCQATGGYPPEVVDEKGQFNLNGMQMEVDKDNNPTGRFRTSRPGRALRPRALATPLG